MDAPIPRVRSRGGLVPSEIIHVNTVFPSTTTSFKWYWSPFGVREQMTDVVDPLFHQKVRNGKIVNNPMAYLRESAEYEQRTVTFFQTHPLPGGQTMNTYTGGYGSVHRSWLSDPLALEELAKFELIDEDSLVSQAAVKARSRIEPAKVMGLVTAAEFPKTLALIASSVSTLRRFTLGVLKGSPKESLEAIVGRKFNRANVPSRISDSVARRWLEYRYGWTPLVFEVKGALEAMQPRALPARQTARGAVLQIRDSSTNMSSDRGNAGMRHYTVKRIHSVNVRSYILYEADLQFQHVRDFGLAELPATAWELVPWSFVVDWFIPVGDWLQAVTPKVGVKILAEGYTISTEKIVERLYSQWVKQIVSGVSFDESGGLGSLDRYSIRNRYRRTSLDRALSFPTFNVKLNKTRALDALALLFGLKGRVR